MRAQLFASAFVALVVSGCKEKVPAPPIVDAAPAASVAEVDANLPWATEIVVDAGAPAASTTAQAAAPAQAPNAQVAYSGPTGTYVGNVKDSGDVYSITVQLSASGATVSYGAPLNCRGKWSPTGHSDTSYKYVEKLTENKAGSCADNVPILLTRDPSRPNAWLYSGGKGQALAVLTKL